MTEINAYSIGINYADTYGIHTTKLGCVMLNTESPLKTEFRDTQSVIDFQKVYSELRDKQYKSEQLPYVQGLTDELDTHLTVRYGFLPEVKTEHLKQIIDFPGLAMSKPTNRHLQLGNVEVWPSTNGEEYECVVVRVIDEHVAYWYRLFGMLPNIVTFPEYKAHITIGYFKPGTWQPEYNDIVKYTVMSRDWRFNSALS